MAKTKDETGDVAVWEALQKKLGLIANAKVKVGVLAAEGGQSVHPDSNMTLIELAYLHEFGNEDRDGHIPERSFIRSTVAKFRDEGVALQRKVARGVLMDKLTPQQALGILGQWLVTKIKHEITNGDGIPPPNKPATIRAKGSSRPLVDTGILVNSINWQVVMLAKSDDE